MSSPSVSNLKTSIFFYSISLPVEKKMESLTPKSHRTPLKQLNSIPADSAPVSAKAKRKTVEERGCRMAVEVSLADELGAIRRKGERVKAERKRMDMILREMDFVLDRKIAEMERRWVEQKKVEDDLKQCVASIKDPFLELELRFLLDVSLFLILILHFFWISPHVNWV